jgi:hypothetical protein
MKLRKATVSEASLCEDPDRAAGTLVLKIKSADEPSYPSTSIDAEVCCIKTMTAGPHPDRSLVREDTF